MPMNQEQRPQDWAQPWPAKPKNAATRWYSQTRRDVGSIRPIGRDDLPF